MLSTLVLSALLGAAGEPTSVRLPVALVENSSYAAHLHSSDFQAQDPQKAAPQNTLSKEEQRHQKDLEEDRELGKQYSAEAEKEYKLSTDPELIAKVQRIGSEFAAIANVTPVSVIWGDKRLNTFNYTFKVIKGDDVNAFSIPGGYIYFFEGLLKRAESDDEIAGVMAHEVAHASLRHVAQLRREQSRLQNLTLPLILATILSGGALGAELVGLSQVIGVAKTSGWSVQAETAADYAGFQYMLKSRYIPTGMLTFMERLALRERETGNPDWGIYRSHPPGRERAMALNKYMSQFNLPIRRSLVTSTFRCSMRPGENGTVQLYFGERRLFSLGGPEALTRGDTAVSAINAFMDGVPEAFELRTTPSGAIVGRGRPLVYFNHFDAESANLTIDALREKATRNLRLCLLTMGYKVWNEN